MLTVLTLINRMGTMVVPFLTVYLTTQRGFDLSQAGLLVSAFGFGAFGGAWLGGKFTDLVGPNRVIMASLLIGGGFFILLQWATGFAGIFTMIFFSALFGEAYRPAMMAAVGQYATKAEAGRAMALQRLAINLGMSLSPVVGGLVAVSIGYAGLFWIDGLTCIAAAIFFLLVSRNWPSDKPQPKSESANPSAGAVQVPGPLRNPTYLYFLVGTFFMALGFLQWFHSVPVFIKTEWGFDERFIGVLMGFNCLIITLIELPIIHVIERKGKAHPSLLAGLLCMACSFLPFLLPVAWYWAYLAMLLLTAGEIFYLPLNNASALKASPAERRGDYLAWYSMVWSLAQIAGPAVGLHIAARYGFSVFWWVAAAWVFIGFVMMLLQKRLFAAPQPA